MKKLICLMISAILISGCATTSAKLPRGAQVVDYKTYPNTPKVMNAVNKVRAVTEIANTPINVYFIKSTGKENYSAAHIGTYKDTSGVRGRSFVITTASAENFTDMELLCLWAHELAHAELKHVDRKVNKSNATTAFFQGLGWVVPYAGYGNLVANRAIVSSYGRKAEMEANRQAVIYLAKLGYSKETMLQFMSKLKSNPGFFSEHPDIQLEIKDVEDMPQPQVIGPKLTTEKKQQEPEMELSEKGIKQQESQESKSIASSEKFSLLKISMSTQQVVNILGKPDVIDNLIEDVWTYQNVGYVNFDKDDKVKSWLIN